jgi:B12 binding domain
MAPILMPVEWTGTCLRSPAGVIQSQHTDSTPVRATEAIQFSTDIWDDLPELAPQQTNRRLRHAEMKILLYNPDNGITRNFMPHLWMFLLQALTPPEHEVILIDGNTQPLTDAELVRFIQERRIGLVGIGAMTRMIAKAYRVADAIRAVGIPVVMGGPHVTEVPGEALGRDGGPRHADAVATWVKPIRRGRRLWPTPSAAN